MLHSVKAQLRPFVLAFAALVAPLSAQDKTIIRIGHFPNITHAQALVAAQLTRQGNGWFETFIPGVQMQWFVYNAGPSAMEAIIAGSIDVTYVGPNPVLNTYSRSQGQEIRVLAGAAAGGTALVVQGDGSISKPGDFKGRKLATPQLGNTQDVSARAWLKKQGFRITQLGGDVFVLPTQNPDQLALFQQRKLDAVWTVEPWVTRLEREAGGKIFLEDDESLVTVLASSVKFLRDKPDLARKLVAAHLALTKWIIEHPDEAQVLVRAELKEQTKRDFPAETAAQSWKRLKFNGAVSRDQFEALVKDAQEVGFLKDAAPLDRLVVAP